MVCDFREGVQLKSYTTLQIGGTARYFVTVTTIDALETAVRFAQENGLPFLVIGGGSNLFVADEGFEGLVIEMKIAGRAYHANERGVCGTFGAGENLDSVIADMVERGYWGIENLSGIPGTVGATPVQNVGAYGVEVKDYITNVLVYDTKTHQIKNLTNADCQFAYRESIFKTDEGRHLIVCAVTFQLTTTAFPRIEYADLRRFFHDEPMPTQAAIRRAVIAIRTEKFPDWQVLGTAGSFFKNPIIPRDQALALQVQYRDIPIFPVSDTAVKISLGYILDKICHLKGYRSGSLGLYEKQALVLVNYGGASAQEVRTFVSFVTEQVMNATGISIEAEVRYIE